MIALLGGLAMAGAPELALLPLDALPGASTVELQAMIAALDDALRADGRTRPISGDALTARVEPGHRLDEARRAAKEGAALLQEGDADLAIVFLEESIQHHRELASEVVRRDEIADVWFALGRASLAVGDRDRARTELGRALAVWPDFEETRAGALDADTRGLLAEAGARLRGRSPVRTSPTAASKLSSRLGTTWVVYGGVTDDGLVLFVQKASALPVVVRRAGPITASPVTWTAVASDVVAATLPAPAPKATVPAPPQEKPLAAPPPVVPPTTPKEPRRDPRNGAAATPGLDLPCPIG